jgi:nucleotide-binding universal stress UspA family protein
VNLEYLDIGIGIATDTVMIGPIGGKHLRDFSVFGDAVNLAAHLEYQARGGKRVLADHRTYVSVTDLVEAVQCSDTSELKDRDQRAEQPYRRYHLIPKQPAPVADAQVFLSHNSRDKPTVRQLAEALKARGLRVWLDEWELIPGRPWQEALEEMIKTAKCAAVLLGKDGLGPWEIPEMRGCLSEFVKRNMPVIPVLLPGASTQPDLPLFLQQFTWVDLREGLTDQGLDRLQWGITGKKPQG